MLNQRGASVIGVGIIAAVVGVLIGFGVSTLLTPKTQTDSTSSSPSPDPITKAADLRVKLDVLLQEHTELTASSSVAIVAGLPEATAVAAQVDKNSNDLADTIGGYYGNDNRQKFYDSWKAHVTNLSDYAAAVKKGDKTAMTTTSQAVTSGGQNLANLLAGLNNQFSAADLNTLLSQHEGDLKKIVDSYSSKDYAGAFGTERTAINDTLKLGDYLASGIVKQNQSQF